MFSSFTNIYRDRDHKGFNDYFIPCFGCSFTYGEGQPDTDTWPHILAKKTDKNYLERNGNKLPIIPGMVASVDIVTGQKSILDFILKPILKVKQDSLHER